MSFITYIQLTLYMGNHYSKICSNCIYVSAVIKYDVQQQQLFCKTLSPQSPVCTDESMNQRTSPVLSLIDKNKHIQVQMYSWCEI
jgi:hypothetical protein